MRFSPQPQSSEIEKFLEAGKTERAVKAAVRQLKRMAPMVTNVGGGFMGNQGQELFTLLDAHGLREQVIKAADPGPKGTATRVAQYGRILELLDRPKLARERYVSALAKRGKQPMVRLRLGLLLLKDEEEDRAAEVVAKIDPKALPAVAMSLFQSMQMGRSNRDDPELPLRVVVLCRRYLEGLDRAVKADLSWAPLLLGYISSQLRSAEAGTLPSLYALPNDQSSGARRGKSEAFKALVAKRRLVHDGMCKVMLEFPQLAASGFTKLLAAAEANGEATEEFKTLAREALLKDQPKQGGMMGMAMMMRMNFGGQEGAVPFRTPGEFLVRHTALNDPENMPEVLEELSAAMQGKKAKQAKRLEAFSLLYTCPPETFLQSVKAYAKAQKQPGNPFGGGGASPVPSLVMEVRSDRELTVDLGPFLIEQSLSAQGGGFGGGRNNTLVDWAVHIETSKPGAAVAFFEQLAVKLIGPPDKREAIIKRHYVANMITGGTPNARIHQYSNFLGECGQKDALLFLAIEAIDALALPGQSNVHWKLRSKINQVGRTGKTPEEKAAKVLKVLERSHGLDELSTFRSYPMGNQDSVVGSLVKRLGQDVKAQVLTGLQERETSTFGVRLISSLLGKGTREKQAKAAYEVLGANHEALKALAAPRLRELVGFIDEVLRSAKPETLSEPAQAVYDWLQSSQSQEELAWTDTFLKAKRLSELKIQSHQLVQKLRGPLKVLVKTERAKAHALLAHAVKLHKKAQRRSGGMTHYGQGGTWMGNSLGQLLQRNMDFETALFLLEVVCNPEGPKVELTSWVRSQLGRAVLAEWIRLAKDPRGQLVAFTESLEGVSKRDLPLLCVALGTPVQGWNKKNRDEGLEASRVEGASPAAVEIGMAVRAYRARRSRGRKGPPDSALLTELAAHYQPVLADGSVSFTGRLVVAEWLLGVLGKASDSELALAAGRLLVEAYTQKAPVVYSQAKAVAEALNRSEPTPARAELAETLCKRWADTRLATRGFTGISGQDLIPMLELSLAAEKPAVTNRIFKTLLGKQNGQQVDMGSILVVLVRNRAFDRAGRIVRTRWASMGASQNRGRAQGSDERLEEAMPAFLETLEEEGLRFFAEVMLSKSPVRSSGSRARADEIEKRSQRLAALAERLSSVTFAKDAMKAQVIAVLATEPSAAVHLRPELAELAGSLHFVPLQTKATMRGDAEAKRKLNLLLSHLGQELAQGRSEAFVTSLNGLIRIHSGQSEWVARQGVQSLMQLIAKTKIDWSPEIATSLLPLAGRLLALPPKIQQGRQSEGLVFVFLVHTFSGKAAELEEKLNKLSETERKAFGRRSYSLLRGLKGTLDKLPVAERVEFLVTGLGTLKSVLGSRGVLTDIGRVKLLSKDELLEHGARLAEAAPCEGSSWYQLARRYQSSKRYDDGLGAIAKAVEAAPNAKGKATFQLLQVELLEKLGEKEEAYRVLSAISAEGQRKVWVRKRDRLLKKLAPKKVEPKPEAPKPEAPETEAPKTEAPETEAPKTEAPETEAPKTEAPETEAPKPPKTEAPETEAPKPAQGSGS